MTEPNNRRWIRPCTVIWLVLMGLTFVTYAAGELGLSGKAMIITLLVIALVKAQMVADYFMGLRWVRGFWRPVVTGYLLVLGALIATAFLTTA